MEDDSHPLDYYPDEATGDQLIDSLALIDKARAALAQAENLSDIGAVIEIAERGRRYAKAAKLGLEAENHAAALRLEAERQAGTWLAETEKQRPGQYQQRSQNGTVAIPPRLADLAITKRQSSDWQAVARVPEPVFREHVERIKTAGRPLTTSGLVDVARKIARAERRDEPKPIIEPSAIPARIEVADARCLPIECASVDLIVTSPPYGLDKAYEGSGDIAAEEWARFMVDWLREALRVTRLSGRLALNVPLDTSEPTYRPTYAQAVAAALAAGWEYASTVVWHDDQTTKGGWALGSQSSAARPRHVSQVEMIALFSKGAWAPSSDNPDDITPDQFLEAGRGPWKFPGETRRWEGHPAPYPLELPRRLIRYLCRVGDVVLDPFVGSGTTALAAIDLGRQAIGFDRSQKYVDSSLRRLAAYSRRSDADDAARDGAGVRESRPGTDEQGRLYGGLHRGASSAPESIVVQDGPAGVAV